MLYELAHDDTPFLVRDARGFNAVNIALQMSLSAARSALYLALEAGYRPPPLTAKESRHDRAFGLSIGERRRHVNAA